jgi:hypothetical protein
VLGRATGNPDTQDSPQPGLEGSHHLPPYSILCTSPRGPHPNGFLSRDSQVGIPKLQQLGFLQLWGRITSCADLRSQWGLKQSCRSRQNLFNGMSHVACTHGNRVDSRLLVVESQIANLTPGHSFGHNLCYRCPNGQCEPILGICASRAFRWYKERLKARSFDPWNCALKIQKSFWDSNSQHGSSLGSVRVHALTFFALPGACEVTPRFSSWPTTFQPLTLVASPRLGLRHFPYKCLIYASEFSLIVKWTWKFNWSSPSYGVVLNILTNNHVHRSYCWTTTFKFEYPTAPISLMTFQSLKPWWVWKFTTWNTYCYCYHQELKELLGGFNDIITSWYPCQRPNEVHETKTKEVFDTQLYQLVTRWAI